MFSQRHWSLLLLATGCLLALSTPQLHAVDPVVIRYWEKWAGFEADAMREIVDDFNSSQSRIFVEYSSVSQIDRRLTLAIAGGVPPDVAGIWAYNIPVYSENNALTPLTSMAEKAGIREDDYLPIIWKLCSHRNQLWALPSTPGNTALIYNKKLFREAGLDPERPPRTIAELEEFNEKIFKRSANGRIERIGHLAEEPGWWNGLWGSWFGGALIKGDSELTATSQENLEAYRWVQSYPERFGAEDLLGMRDGFGNFASPQNAFFTGRVAMIMQGVWIYNYIQNYAPADFEWGVAPFPTNDPEKLGDVSVVECDVLVIPHGAKHPLEAFEFITYVNSQKNMEKLCLGQRKFSPLRVCSDEFFQKHPNPHIRTFLELAKSPGAISVPRVAVWNAINADMRNAVNLIWTGKAPAEDALQAVQERQQKALTRSAARWERVEESLQKSWNSQ